MFSSDVFISYAVADAERFGGEENWIERFCGDLEDRLALSGGRKVSISLRRMPEPDLPQPDTIRQRPVVDPALSPLFDSHTQEDIRNSALFVPIISPSFIKSDVCMQELECFIQAAGRERVIKVVKSPTQGAERVAGITEQRFYRGTAEGLSQGLERRDYHRAIGELAAQLLLVLRSVKAPVLGTANKDHQRRLFLCHASEDKAAVRALRDKLAEDGFTAWLDEQDLLPGQKWEEEIPRAIDSATAVMVCLSNRSVTKEGYLQKEIKMILDKADEKPEGTIFLIPARLEECPVPSRLRGLQWVNLFEMSGYSKLKQALEVRWQQQGRAEV
jgi:TIR domain-containing protein